MSVIKTIRAFVLATRGVLGGHGLPSPETGGDPIEFFRPGGVRRSSRVCSCPSP